MTETFIHEITNALETIRTQLQLEQTTGSIPQAIINDLLANNYSAALNKIETRLHEHGADSEIKLFWIRCQMALDKVPVTALIAPLEEIADDLLQKSTLHQIAADSFLSIATKLIKRDKLRVALTALERGITFISNDTTLDPKLHAGLNTLLAKVITEEIKRAENRRDTETYIGLLKTKLIRLEGSEKQTAQRPNQLRRSSGAKEVLARAPIEELTSPLTLADKEVTNSIDLCNKDTQENVNRDIDYGEIIYRKSLVKFSVIALSIRLIRKVLSIKDATTRKILVTTTISFFVIICAILLLKYIKNIISQIPEKDLSIVIARLDVERLELPTLKVAEASLADYTNEKNSFNDLSERLKNLSTKSASSGSNQNDGTVTTTAKDEIDRSGLKWNGEQVVPPVEKREYSTSNQDNSIRAFPNSQANIQLKKSPYLNSERIGHMDVQIIGSSPRGTSVENLIKGKDGQYYAPLGGLPQDSGRKPINNIPLQSYPVERLEPPVRYETIINCEVLSAPSFVATRLASLPKGAEIQAITRLGPWIEILPHKGQRAFVMMQNVLEKR